MSQIIDAIPSATKQGYSVQLMKSEIGGYNCGLTKFDGGLRLIARICEYKMIEGAKRLMFSLAWFKQKEANPSEVELLGRIKITDFPEHLHAEDPRVFDGPDGELYVSFCQAADDIEFPPVIRVGKFRADDRFAVDLLPVTLYKGNGAEKREDRKPQKNWNFFFKDRRLFCIYWTYPHKVVELDPVTMQVIAEFSGEDDKRFIWQYGPLSGGTPPVVWRNKYLAFYHGFMPHQTRRRRYYMGAYTFEMEPPFRILEITAPLLRGSLNDPTNFEPPNHAGLPLVVFPCGLRMEDTDPDQANVSLGVNDSYMSLATFDMRTLPITDIQEMREARTFYFFTQDTSIPVRANQWQNLPWQRIKEGAGGIIATQNPFAIDDCLTRGGIGEISREMYMNLVVADEGGFDPATPRDTETSKMQRLFDSIVEVVCRLPGWSSPQKNMEFASIILASRPKVAVEIGVYGGRSVLSMAMAMQMVGEGGVVHAIDPWSPKDSIEGESPENVEWWGKLDHEAVFRTFKAATDRFGLNEVVKIQRKRSDEAEVPDDIGLLIIDGNHSSFAPMGDVTRYVPKVKVGGFIYMDDIGWVGGSVHAASEQLQDLYGCKLLYTRDNGAMFQKISDVSPRVGSPVEG